MVSCVLLLLEDMGRARTEEVLATLHSERFSASCWLLPITQLAWLSSEHPQHRHAPAVRGCCMRAAESGSVTCGKLLQTPAQPIMQGRAPATAAAVAAAVGVLASRPRERKLAQQGVQEQHSRGSD